MADRDLYTTLADILLRMEQSIFTEKSRPPGNNDLEQALGKSFATWAALKQYVLMQCPAASEEWNFSKAGWNCRLRDSKRVIVYLMPGKNVFRVSFVLGRKAVTEGLSADISEDIKTIISAAKTYAEGTGVRIEVGSKKMLADLKTLTDLKLKH